MRPASIAFAAPAALCCWAALAAPPDPADPKAPATALRYESSLSTAYRAAGDVKPAPWKRTNEAVEALGGHGGHLKALEAQRAADPKPEPAVKPDPATKAGPAKDAAPARGHHRH